MEQPQQQGPLYRPLSAERPELLKPNAPGEHVWIATSAHRIAAEALRSDTVMMDRENLAMIQVGCWVCEEPYSKRLSYRRCPGEPQQ